ncbi:MAG: hypothetical protein JOZ54_16120, partial [Acidobacteria bacterium]|nr:hypothetical protein [Acidobacteriota bacterium]
DEDVELGVDFPTGIDDTAVFDQQVHAAASGDWKIENGKWKKKMARAPRV